MTAVKGVVVKEVVGIAAAIIIVRAELEVDIVVLKLYHWCRPEQPRQG
jgi:hypothetical protein